MSVVAPKPPTISSVDETATPNTIHDVIASLDTNMSDILDNKINGKYIKTDVAMDVLIDVRNKLRDLAN